ncbi:MULTISPECIES: WXG100 family type VII secretion target [Mycolicibacterium]|uniref:Uncharacterized protein n=1 Tax=Mycolicibacterium vanbaalenii (strain DSM 7251 / JCM 13017 / BCRC 16820 / KCTC 9966 / NRRL B-24157 / PYR-1) TaxID=350058 RepID=A1T3T4_MYCVP|nr:MULTISPECIES: hypothetical protein [Mycolicibacterium]ABM11834.1 protein of unknown function DUF1023 [Mycolicibacterium vanbaalenii PYR-1]WND57709.1 hypothetical protein QQA43_04620 [Mycolicibacterium vanbaalenii]
MPVTVSRVEASNLASLTAAATELRAKIGQLDALITEQRGSVRRLRAAWRGAAGEGTITQAERNLAAQVQLRDRLAAVQETLDTGGSRLTATRDGLTGVVEALRASGWTVTDAGHAIAPPFPPLLTQFEPGFTALIRRLLRLFDEIDAGTAAGISGVLRQR